MAQDPRIQRVQAKSPEELLEPQKKVAPEAQQRLLAVGFDIESVLERFSALKTARSGFTRHWQEIADVLAPSASDSFTDEGGTLNYGNFDKQKRLYDTTGSHANELLSSGFFSLLTSPTQPWFMLKTNVEELNDQYDVSAWLDNVSRIMAYEIQRPQTGFTTALHEFYLEYGGWGNGIAFITETQDRSSLVFITLPLAECFYQENDEGRVDTLYRRYWRTPQQLVERFGEQRVHETVRDAYLDSKSQKQFEIVHAILPNIHAQAHALFSDELPYISAYIDKTNKFLMSISGFEEQPFMAARFYKMPNEVYGRGPGSIALPDLNMLQEMVRTVLRGAQKMVDPPMMMPDQGFLTPPNMAPGRVNYFRAGTSDADRIFPIQTAGHPEIGMDLIQSIQNRIREIFFVDQLQLNVGPQMTATEVLQRTEEKQRLMGPVIGRASTELLSPLIQRVFGLLMRQGKIPMPPDAIIEMGAQFRIVYTSPIFKAQEQIAANNLTRALQVLTPFMAADPTILQAFSPERTAQQVAKMFNLPTTMMRTEEELAALEQAQQQAMNQQQQAVQLKDQGIGLRNLAQAGATLQSMS